MVIYTALGDSITAGEGATSPARAYPSLIVSGLCANSVRAWGRVLAQPGWTSRALDSAVFDNPSSCLSQSTAISIWIGGDNLAYAGLAILRGAPSSLIQRTILEYGRDVAVLVTAIHKVSKAHVIVCTQYNPFPNSPLAGEAVAALNASTYTVASKLGVSVAPAHSWFEGQQAGLLAGYKTGRMEDAISGPRLPIHPNNTGHAVIAQGLLPFIR
jgi:acyl-CoA thioesterase I